MPEFSTKATEIVIVAFLSSSSFLGISGNNINIVPSIGEEDAPTYSVNIVSRVGPQPPPQTPLGWHQEQRLKLNIMPRKRIIITIFLCFALSFIFLAIDNEPPLASLPPTLLPQIVAIVVAIIIILLLLLFIPSSAETTAKKRKMDFLRIVEVNSMVEYLTHILACDYSRPIRRVGMGLRFGYGLLSMWQSQVQSIFA